MLRFLLYNAVFAVLFVLLMPFYLIKQVRRGGLSWAYLERFGCFGRKQKRRLRELNAPVWIHAVSVGEVAAALTLIAEWRKTAPHRSFVLSTTTTTGHAVAQARLPDGVALIYFPVDCFFWVRRTLRLVRPSMLLLLEVEIWPNLIWAASRRGVPVALANGRLSERSAARTIRHRWFFRSIFERFSLFCVQTDTDAARIRAVLGETPAPVQVSGTMKFDQVPEAAATGRRGWLEDFFGVDSLHVLTAGSTHPGEEEVILDTFAALREEFPGLRVVLVPRHHERTQEVESLLRSRDFAYTRLTDTEQSGGGAGPTDILLVNTTGQLTEFYAASDIVFVGKSLAGNTGGHNIIEPAIFGKPVLHGPGMENFRTVTHLFRAAHGTVEVEDGNALTQAVAELLRSPDKAEKLGRRARAVVDQQRGATAKTISRCEELL